MADPFTSTHCATKPVKQWYQSHGSLPDHPNPHFASIHARYNRNRDLPQPMFKPKTPHRMTLLEIQDEVEKLNKEKDRRLKRVKCFICKEKGHMFWSCDKKKAVLNRPETREHLDKFNLSKLILDPDFLLIGTDEGNWDEIWYVSKCYDKHMTNTSRIFENFTYQHMFEYIKGRLLDVYGTGEVWVKNGSNNSVLIREVCYCPDINVNILSLKKLKEQGLTIVSSNRGCKITDIDQDIGIEYKGSYPNDLETEKRELAVKVTKDLLETYTSKYCDKIGDKKLKGLSHQLPENVENCLSSNLRGIISLIDFVLKENDPHPKVKESMSKNFEKMLGWFYKSNYCTDQQRDLPVVMGQKTLDLLELYRAVKVAGGSSMVTLKDEWDKIAERMKIPDWYERKLRAVYAKYLQKIDACYDTVKNLESVDSDQSVELNGQEVELNVKDHDSFIVYMDTIQDFEIAMRFIKQFRGSFDEVMNWFHNKYLNIALELPPKVNGLDVCLFDLYVLVNRSGGTRNQEMNWEEVAQRFGFTTDEGFEFASIYEHYLETPEIYYKAIKSSMERPGQATYAPQEREDDIEFEEEELDDDDEAATHEEEGKIEPLIDEMDENGEDNNKENEEAETYYLVPCED